MNKKEEYLMYTPEDAYTIQDFFDKATGILDSYKEKFPPEIQEHILFHSGIILGQIEKIHIGACHAAIFRSSLYRNTREIHTIIYHFTEMYQLWATSVVYTGKAMQKVEELWITRNTPELNLLVDSLNYLPAFSSPWESTRSFLLGNKKED